MGMSHAFVLGRAERRKMEIQGQSQQWQHQDAVVELRQQQRQLGRRPISTGRGGLDDYFIEPEERVDRVRKSALALADPQARNEQFEDLGSILPVLRASRDFRVSSRPATTRGSTATPCAQQQVSVKHWPPKISYLAAGNPRPASGRQARIRVLLSRSGRL